MAPLYRRFIPPKPVDSPAAPAKRRRERSEEEIAERKAKKLRKKGVEVDVDEIVAQTRQEKEGATDVEQKAHVDEEGAIKAKQEARDEAGAKPEPSGAFAHVKNDKKRHRLEKEARKARKAAERVMMQENGHGQAQTSEAGAAASVVAETETTPQKRRKERKERTGRSGGGEGQRQSVEGSDDGGTNVGQEHNRLAAAPPTKRRHKLEAVLLQEHPAPEGGHPDGSDHLRKHGGVLAKFQKSVTRTCDNQARAPPELSVQEAAEKPLLRHLEPIPIPLPPKHPTPDLVPDASSLPRWLAHPHVIPSDRHATFEHLELDPNTVKHLSALGLQDALPVQQALVPLLLPPGLSGASFPSATEPVLPDLAVSAATGSGKTIAYLLPIIKALDHAGNGLGRLRSLIVVPTRELVMQVAAVAKSLAQGSPVTVGMATGTGKLKDEQEKLIRKTQKHDPARSAALLEKAHRRNHPPDADEEAFDEYMEELVSRDAREDQRLDDAVHCLVDHVPVYQSTVDVLVCTPGRLLEHIANTLGFTLAHLEWLVLDEADKLLDQQYDGFLDTVNTEISRPRTLEEQDGRERLLKAHNGWDEQRERRVRKVVLSATMTRDIGQLSGLRLFRPRLLVVRGRDGETVAGAEPTQTVDGGDEVGGGWELPRGLVEYCVPVGDGSEKPLFLVKLLEDRIMPVPSSPGSFKKTPLTAPAMDLEDSVSDSDSDGDSSLSDSSSDNTSDSDVDSSSITSTPSAQSSDRLTGMHPSRAALFTSKPPPTTAPTILIFTSSTESAHRLSYLLKALKPPWTSYISTLTKSKPSRRLPLPQPGHPHAKLSITISTDRSSRGLDALRENRRITHVLQYDVPRSLTSYIHRVGRTARAGQHGEAWTLYSHSEARWFLKEVAQAGSVRRAQAVEKVTEVRHAVERDRELREVFERALQGMREVVYGGEGKGRWQQ